MDVGKGIYDELKRLRELINGIGVSVFKNDTCDTVGFIQQISNRLVDDYGNSAAGLLFSISEALYYDDITIADIIQDALFNYDEGLVEILSRIFTTDQEESKGSSVFKTNFENGEEEKSVFWDITDTLDRLSVSVKWSDGDLLFLFG